MAERRLVLDDLERNPGFFQERVTQATPWSVEMAKSSFSDAVRFVPSPTLRRGHEGGKSGALGDTSRHARP